MTLTYIFHSGFVLETDSAILVFDYWLDPSRVMPSVLCGWLKAAHGGMSASASGH